MQDEQNSAAESCSVDNLIAIAAGSIPRRGGSLRVPKNLV